MIRSAAAGVELTLVHALIVGQGPIEGVVHWHAWVEHGPVAYDWSNGKNISLPVDVYRALARVQQSWEYDAREAAQMMRLTQHFGPWQGPVDDHP